MAYAPAGQTTQSPGLTHLATVWYNRVALDQVRQMFRFQSVCDPDQIPLRSGKTAQWYRYTLLGANTVPSAEGVVGQSVPQSTTTVSATVSEYSDFTSGSTLLTETAIDSIAENHASNLGYRAGLTVDTITRLEFDSNVAAAGVALNTLGATATVQDGKQAVALLRANNVRPREGDEFVGIMSPYILYDIQSDNTAGGFIDITKYSKPEMLLSGEIGMAGGVRFVLSNNVGTTGAVPNVQYYYYVVGKGAVGCIDLAGRGPSKIVDPSKQDFKVAVVKGGTPAIYDPTGTIGWVCSYRFVFVAKTMDSTT